MRQSQSYDPVVAVATAPSSQLKEGASKIVTERGPGPGETHPDPELLLEAAVWFFFMLLQIQNTVSNHANVVQGSCVVIWSTRAF